MALNPPSPFRVRPLPVIAASAVASAVFVVVIAVVARLTADGVAPPRGLDDDDEGAPPDAGVVGDAGPDPETITRDAGVLFTVEPGPDAGPEADAGPPGVEPPPYDPGVVVAAAAVVIERCARDALRWDPSLGGPFTVRVVLPAGGEDGAAVRIAVSGLPSPILETCLARAAPLMPRAPGTDALGVVQAVQARGVLRASGAVDIADPVIVAATTEERADDRPPR